MELEERYGQSNGPQLYQVQKKLAQISQGSNSITSYYTRIKRQWDELKALSSLPQCSCGAMQELQNFDENQKLIQLLMGLNESCTTAAKYKTSLFFVNPRRETKGDMFPIFFRGYFSKCWFK